MIRRLCQKLNGEKFSSGHVWLLLQKTSFSLRAEVREDSEREQKIHVGGGIKVNCLKVGQGPRNLLLIPGAMGTIWTDYKSQIEGLDKTKFTLVVMEQPGFGKSRPPDREFSTDMFHRDADWGAKVMQELNLDNYSPLGWSGGGVTAMILAARYPERVKKLVVWGSNAYISPKDMEYYTYISEPENFSDHMKETYLSYYTEEYFLKCWPKLYEAFFTIYREHDGDLCKHLLGDIHCPTLILHGNLDPMIAPEHARYLQEHIQNSRLHIFPGGKHNIHLRNAAEFNKLVEDFLE